MRRYLSIACMLILMAQSHLFAAEKGWKEIDDGFHYRNVPFETLLGDGSRMSSSVHIFKIDPVKFKLRVINAKDHGLLNFDAETMAKKSGAILAVNGSFFTPEFLPLGLIVNEGKVQNKLKWTGWWHIFEVRNKVPRVLQKQEFLPDNTVEMAIEAGPRVLIDGVVPQGIKESIAERTAIGVMQDGSIMIAVTDSHPMSIGNFGEILKKNGCYNALNLDGGSSTQMFSKYKGFGVSKRSFALVANGVGVFPR